MNLAPTSCGSHSGRRWYCASSTARQEYLALGELLAQKFEAYLPLHLERPVGHPERERIVPMFPGYLFVAFDRSADPWRRILGTRGIWNLLSATPEHPLPLPVDFVEDLIDRTSARRVVDDPGTDRRFVYLLPGQRARVADGAMAGWKGICTQSGPSRVRLLLSLFGGYREVELKSALVVGL